MNNRIMKHICGDCGKVHGPMVSSEHGIAYAEVCDCGGKIEIKISTMGVK